MNVIGTVILILIIVATALGLIIGIFKGFSQVKSWGIEYLLASLLTVLIGGAVSKNFAEGDAATGGIINICLALALINAFAGFSALLRKIFRKSKRKKIEKGGKRKGPSGFVDRIFGAVTLAVKGFVIAGVFAAFVLAALDLSQLAFVTEKLGDIYSNAAWINLKPYLMDFFYIGVLMAAIRCGYRSGISNALWTVVVIGLAVFAGFVSYNLAFKVEAFTNAASNLAPTIEGLLGDMGNPDLALTVSKWAITVGMFLLMLIVVILIGIFVPRFLNSARDGKIFYAIDGTLGATFALVIVAGVLLLAGSIVQPISDLDFMAKFTSYFDKSAVATYFYDNNLINFFAGGPLVPIRDYFVPQ